MDINQLVHQLDLRYLAAMKLWKGFFVGGFAGYFFLKAPVPPGWAPLYYGSIAGVAVLVYVLMFIDFWLFRVDLKKAFPEYVRRLMRGVKLAIILGVFMNAAMVQAARRLFDFDVQNVKGMPLEDVCAVAGFAGVTFFIARAWSKKVANAR